MASSSAPPASPAPGVLSEQFSPESSAFPSLTLTPESVNDGNAELSGRQTALVPANTAFFHGTICMLAAEELDHRKYYRVLDVEDGACYGDGRRYFNCFSEGESEFATRVASTAVLFLIFMHVLSDCIIETFSS